VQGRLEGRLSPAALRGSTETEGISGDGPRWPSERTRMAKTMGRVAKTMGRVAMPSLYALFSALRLVIVGLAIVFITSPSVDAQPPIYTLNDPHKIKRLTIPQNKSTTLKLDRDFKDVLVGNENIADIVPLTNRSLYVLGKSIGTTRLVIFDANKELLGVVEVEVSYDVDELNKKLREIIPYSRVTASPINGKILLSGVAHDALAVQKAVGIAKQFAPEEAVTNSIGVDTSQQVLLEVRFVEVNRNAGRELGVNWGAISQNGNFRGATGGARLNAPALSPPAVLFPFAGGALLSGSAPFGTFLQRVLSGGLTADVIVEALEERGLARRLAEPNLVALSGDTASFLAGGEFPIPVAQDNDTITVEFKKFGVGLAFTPTVLARGMINLKVEPEVSEIDPTASVTINDIAIPGLTVRRASTTLELRDGQSFAMAGLLQFNNSKEQRQLPWIGKVPVLGALFRSASYQKKESDLVIIVTPRLVKPAVPGEHLVTPLEKSIPTNDVEFFLLGKQERWKTRVSRPDIEAGHVIDLRDGEVYSQGGGRESFK
jgi:pilus assembly protein CpaC